MSLVTTTWQTQRYERGIMLASLKGQRDANIEWQVDLWTRMQTEEPTVAQLLYVQHLLDTREGADAESVWGRDHISRRELGSIIHELLKLSEKAT